MSLIRLDTGPWSEDAAIDQRRILTTVLFTDIVDSTGRLLEIGELVPQIRLADPPTDVGLLLPVIYGGAGRER